MLFQLIIIINEGICHPASLWFCVLFFSLQVKVSFGLDNIQIKYIDEDNDEVKYLPPHPPNEPTENG